MKKIIFLALTILALSTSVAAQGYSHYGNNQFNLFERHAYKPGSNFHTSIKDYRMDELEKLFDTDSLLYSQMNIASKKRNIFGRFLFDNLLEWHDDDVKVVANPIVDFQMGRENSSGRTTFVNTRGLFIKGNLGKNFHFYTDYLENQAAFPDYVNRFIADNRVVPGQGKSKKYRTDDHDFAQATGYASFNANKYINMQLGFGKNFIGDGYRSLIMSDNSYSYPFAKVTATFMNVKYMIMWNQMNWLSTGNSNDDPYPKKYGVFHYLDWNLGKRFSIGLFESVVWAQKDTTGYRGFEMAYLNPIIFFRPVEYSLGSPDKMLLGINAKYIISKSVTLYGQAIINEFKADEVFSGKKWWANKHGFQAGLKSHNLLGIKNLDLQSEYSQVRPYTYSGYTPDNNYGNYNQPLAHPLGANFRESVTIINYRHQRWFLRGQLNVAMYGDDTNDTNYGHNIYLPSNNRPYDYGHTIGQGTKTNLLFADASLSYLINPRNMMNITIGGRIRQIKTPMETLDSQHLYLSFRMSLKNLYYDF